MISGAQARIPAVAISAPNALLSRSSFDPPITSTQLQEFTFNVVPDRDLIPLVDILSTHFQRISCRAEKYDIVGCHSELQFIT